MIGKISMTDVSRNTPKADEENDYAMNTDR